LRYVAAVSAAHCCCAFYTLLHHWQLSVVANISMKVEARKDMTGEYARILYAKHQ
jgi:hypothetical protein